MYQDALLAFCLLLLQGQKGSLGILPASGAQTCHTTLEEGKRPRARMRATRCHESFVTALCRSVEICGRLWKKVEEGRRMRISSLSIALRAATIQHHPLVTASDSSAVKLCEVPVD